MTGAIVFVVEGPSEKAFWTSVLHRAFPNRRGSVLVRVLHNRDKLIRAAWDIVDESRAAGRACTIFLLDLDKDACCLELRARFESRVLDGAADGDVAVCIAAQCLETWLLTDATAVNAVYAGAGYVVPDALEGKGAETQFLRLGRDCPGAGVGGKRARARKIAAHFDPVRAAGHSRSFDRAWRIISDRLA